LLVSSEALFIELASVRRDTSVPAVEYLKASQVDNFGKVLRDKLLVKDSLFAKSYLQALVDEIVVKDKTATIRGSYAALAETMEHIKLGNLNKQAPSFMHRLVRPKRYIWALDCFDADIERAQTTRTKRCYGLNAGSYAGDCHRQRSEPTQFADVLDVFFRKLFMFLDF
jgi:hypothetical protein